MGVFTIRSKEGSKVSPLLPAAARRLPVPLLPPPKSAGIAAIPHDHSSPEHSRKQGGSAPAKERADIMSGE